MPQTDMTTQLDQARQKNGFMTIAETLALMQNDNIIYDPFSTLIARNAQIGRGNVFYPNTRLETSPGTLLSVGNENVLFSGTVICSANGSITIEDHNSFGDGSILITTRHPEAQITIGSNTRLRGFIEIDGQSVLGDGCQILGRISATDICLAAGGSYQHPIANERGAVLKGTGRAFGLTLATGEVIAGDGHFDDRKIRMQSFYHPDQVR